MRCTALLTILLLAAFARTQDRPNVLFLFADDLLPWADPYIASLVASLEREEQTT